MYRLFGVELSPYSVKVRAYLRYKSLPHVWLTRSERTQAEFERYARLPLVPLLITPEDQGLQDSTPILEALEQRHPQPSIHPRDPIAAFVSELLEEFADEWGNKWMFHYRWARDVDQRSAAGRIARIMRPDAAESEIDAAAARIRERMIGRMGFVGSNPETGPSIEASFLATLELLERHLGARAYLFGGRPALADFGLWGQLYEAWTDPTAGAFIEGRAPAVLAWIHRMAWPQAVGDFEPWGALQPTLIPLLCDQVGALFLPWSVANEQALRAGATRLEVSLAGVPWTQAPQKYHARSLAAIREKFRKLADDEALVALLRDTGCLEALAAQSTAPPPAASKGS